MSYLLDATRSNHDLDELSLERAGYKALCEEDVLGKGVNAKSIPDLVALAKAKPGTLNYGSAGVGSSSHLAGALFASKAKIDVVHVPFRIGADSRTALINGTIQYYVYPLPAIVGMIKAGTLRPLAVGSPKRAESV